MRRMRSQDGYLGYVGILAALVIVAILTLTSFSKLGFGGGSDGLSDAAAQTYAQRAYSALGRCKQQGGSDQTCTKQQLLESDPTLMEAGGHLEVAVGTVTVESADGSYTIGPLDGKIVRACQTPGQGACPLSGRW